MESLDIALYQFFLAMKAEIDRHKWIESEKVGHDVGMEFALIDWTMKYRSSWKIRYIETHQPPSSSIQKKQLTSL